MNGIPFLANANISATMDVDADLANNKYTLKDNTIRLNAIQAGIDGWVALKDPAIDMDLKLNTNDIGFKEILSLIPAIYATEFSSLKTDGTATLTATAKGILQGDTVPAFNIDMQEECHVPLSGFTGRSGSNQYQCQRPEPGRKYRPDDGQYQSFQFPSCRKSV